MSEEELSSTSSDASIEETPSEAGSEPPVQEQRNSIDVVTQWVDNFHIQSNMSVNGSTTGQQGGPSVKVNAPMEFSGQRNQVKAFKMQCLTYIQMNQDKLSDNRKQLLFITSYLRGPAYEWILPHLEDYLENPRYEDLKDTTKQIMAGKTAFFRELHATFGYGNEQMEAERAIQTMQQRGPASKYKAEFLTQVVKTGWDDEAIVSHFYRGLKDHIKDEISRRDERPTTPRDMYALALKIDERYYERQMEKRGGNFSRGNGQANTRARREVPAWRDDYYGLQKMQLDATHGKPGSKGQKKGQKKSKDKSQVECYGCGKKGHYKNECKARKQSHELQKSGKQEAFRATKGKGSEEESPKPATIAATNHWTYEDVSEVRRAYDTTGTNATTSQDDHGLTSWTACCDDSCTIHMSDKMGSGYFPSHRRQSICLTRGMPVPTQAAQEALTHYPALIQEDFSLEEQALEESKEEAENNESSEESDSDEDQFTTSFRAGDIVPVILGRIMLRKDEVFPWINGQQRVHDSAFTQMIWDVRQVLRNTPVVENSVDYRMIVQEWPPIGSDFTARGGYVTPNQICIPRNMRERVRTLKRDYEMEAERQVHEQANRVRPLLPRIPRDEGVPEGERPEVVQAQREEYRRRHPERFDEAERVGDDARDTTPCENVWEPPLSVSDPRYVPHSRHNRLGARSEEQGTSGGHNRANQRSEN